MKTKAGILRFLTSGRTRSDRSHKSVRKPRIGLCLSSGAARGLAHVGVIEVLEEAGIEISAVAGTSMGAYVGSLVAAGLKAADLRRLAAEIPDRRTLLKLMDPVFPPSTGLIRGQKMRKHLERTLGSLTFGELRLPLMVVATDLDRLKPKVFREGNVAAAVHASAAIPGVFAPVEIDGNRFIDGGAAEPLPVSLLRRWGAVDYVIAVNVIPESPDPPPVKPRMGISRWLGWLNLLGSGNVLDTFHRALITAQRQLVKKESALADVVICPDLSSSHWYDYENYERYIEAGRKAALDALPLIRKLLSPQPQPPTKHETLVTSPQLGCCAA